MADNTPLLDPAVIIVNRKKRIFSCILIAIAQGFERMAFYGIVFSIPTWFTTAIFWSNESINLLQFAFVGLSLWLSFITGYISDTFVSRYVMINFGFFLHICGFVYPSIVTAHVVKNMSMNAYNRHFNGCGSVISADTTEQGPVIVTSQDERYLILSGIIIAIGSAAIRTNLAPFGADQVCELVVSQVLASGSNELFFLHMLQLRDVGRRDVIFRITAFFHLLFWSVNLGAFAAFAAMTYLNKRKLLYMYYMCIANPSASFMGLIVFSLGKLNLHCQQHKYSKFVTVAAGCYCGQNSETDNHNLRLV